MSLTEISQHNTEIRENLAFWKKKKILRQIYSSFYQMIVNELDMSLPGKIVELGSGIGNLKTFVPDCICTDLFPNPWIDQVENSYSLSFEDNSLNAIILFDVWHHLEYPGTALKEFNRVLLPKGKVIIFEPDISILGYITYGIFHHEPVNYFKKIQWTVPENLDVLKLGYYASQGNASRIFLTKKYKDQLMNWKILKAKRITSFSYIGSGGYRGKQLYPDKLYPFICRIDRLFGFLPSFFATRLLVVLETKVY
jgi:SAM-dependent methyltransferase